MTDKHQHLNEGYVAKKKMPTDYGYAGKKKKPGKKIITGLSSDVAKKKE